MSYTSPSEQPPPCAPMPVTLTCPACDSEVPTDSTSGTVQCPTCWAKVPVDAARRRANDTPPPRDATDELPTARRARNDDSPPRAKRAERAGEGKRMRKTRSLQEEEKPKSGPAAWVVGAVVMIAVAVVGVAVIFLTEPPANATPGVPTTSPATSQSNEPEDEWVVVATAEGATLLAPGPVKKHPVSVGNEQGVGHSASEGSFTAEVFGFDLKGDRRADREEFLGSLFGVSPERITRSGLRPIPGGDAIEYTASDLTGFSHGALVIGRFGRWFVFHLQWKAEDDPKERRWSAFEGRAAVTWTRVEQPAESVKPKDPKHPEPVKPKDPPRPTPSKTEPEPITETWAAVDNKAGFAAVAPKGVRPERVFIEQKRVHLGGQKWQIDDGHCVYHVSYLDLPDGFEPDTAKLVKAQLPFGNDLGAGSDGTAGGKKGTVWEVKNWDKPKAKAVSAACGFRLFTAFVTSKHGKGYGEDPTFTQRTDKFFAGLKFTFDAKTDDPYPGEPKWAAMANTTGFSAKVPKGNTAVKAHDIGFNPKAAGRHYRHEATGMVFEVFVHDLPAKRSAAEVTKQLLAFDKLVSGPEEVRGADRRWTVYELGGPDRPVLFRTATAGSRVFTIRVFPESHTNDDRVGAREFRDKAAMFFDQFVAED